MEKMNCDIIQDLIPSYVDKICSEASRQCVEDHIKTCETCKGMVDLYNNSDFTADSIEHQTLDGFKKIKAKMKKQNLISYGFLLIVTAFGVYTFLSDTNHMSALFYYSLFLIIMMGTYFLGDSQNNWVNIGKKESTLAVASVLISGYSIFIIYYSIISFLNGNLPFGISPNRIGPFLHTQWGVLFAFQLLIYGYMLTLLIKKNKDSRWILCINLTGIFLLLSYVTLLARLSTFENFTFQHDFIQMTVTLLILGMIGVIYYLYSSFQNRKKTKL